MSLSRFLEKLRYALWTLPIRFVVVLLLLHLFGQSLERLSPASLAFFGLLGIVIGSPAWLYVLVSVLTRPDLRRLFRTSPHDAERADRPALTPAVSPCDVAHVDTLLVRHTPTSLCHRWVAELLLASRRRIADADTPWALPITHPVSCAFESGIPAFEPWPSAVLRQLAGPWGLELQGAEFPWTLHRPVRVPDKDWRKRLSKVHVRVGGVDSVLGDIVSGPLVCLVENSGRVLYDPITLRAYDIDIGAAKPWRSIHHMLLDIYFQWLRAMPETLTE